MNQKPDPMSIADLRRLNPRLDSSQDKMKDPPRNPRTSIDKIRAGLGVVPAAAPAPEKVEKKAPPKKD